MELRASYRSCPQDVQNLASAEFSVSQLGQNFGAGGLVPNLFFNHQQKSKTKKPPAKKIIPLIELGTRPIVVSVIRTLIMPPRNQITNPRITRNVAYTYFMTMLLIIPYRKTCRMSLQLDFQYHN